MHFSTTNCEQYYPCNQSHLYTFSLQSNLASQAFSNYSVNQKIVIKRHDFCLVVVFVYRTSDTSD